MAQQQLMQRQSLRTQPHPQLLAGRAPRHRALVCYARRTISGSSDTRGKEGPLKRPDSRAGKSSAKAATPATAKPAASQQQQQQQQHNSSRGTQGVRRPANQPQRSALEDFMRNTPGFNRFQDGILILGDAVMVLATELSSERLPLEQLPYLGGVAVGSWILAGAILGDYTAEPDPDANPLSDALGWPVFAAVVDAMITWAVAMVVSIFGFSWLVSNFIVEPQMVLEVARDGMLSPQLEISVALLITMSCWRGMAARLRL